MAEEDDSAEKHMVCAWRRDPEDSFSDWTVMVAATTSNAASDLKTNETYHIHKTIVGAGPRCSNYFCRLFKTNGLKESESSTSHIELNESAAIAFPIMLDFIYSHYTVDVQITTETAVALRFLANYFDVPTLAKKVNQFIRKDMNKSNIHIYSREAQLCQDEDVVNDSMKIAAVNWFDMLAPKDGESQAKSRYMDSLPECKQLEMFRLSMKRAGPELEQCKKKLRKCEENLSKCEEDLRKCEEQGKNDSEELSNFIRVDYPSQIKRFGKYYRVNGTRRTIYYYDDYA